MINVFDITDFGAVGDGKKDCTRAIQKAIDEASKCMGKVVVPPGVYMVSHLKLYGKCVSLEGSSAWSFRSYGSSVLKLNSADVDSMIDITGAFGCAIRGISLNGNNLGESIHGIKLYWDKYNGGSEEDTPTIDDCRIGDFSGDGLHFEHIWCFSLRHSMLFNNGGAGLYIDGWDAFIIDNWFTANKNAGVLGGPVANSLTFTGNRIEWNLVGGIVLKNGDSYNITGNFFDRTFGPALSLGTENTNIDLVTITGNIFRRSGAREENEAYENPELSSHMILTNCMNVSCVGNTMRMDRGDCDMGVYSPQYSFIIENCNNCIVKDNTMNNGSLKKNIIERNNTSCIIENNLGQEAEI